MRFNFKGVASIQFGGEVCGRIRAVADDDIEKAWGRVGKIPAIAGSAAVILGQQRNDQFGVFDGWEDWNDGNQRFTSESQIENLRLIRPGETGEWW